MSSVTSLCTSFLIFKAKIIILPMCKAVTRTKLVNVSKPLRIVLCKLQVPSKCVFKKLFKERRTQ